MGPKIADQLAAEAASRGRRAAVHPAAVVRHFELEPLANDLRLDADKNLPAVAERVLQGVRDELVDDDRELDGGIGAGDDVGHIALDTHVAAREPALELGAQ